LKLQLSQYANLNFPVLIEGESGSGKDILASQHLHQLTERRKQPFLAINCAAISPSLIEPTLFGHAKGAFTGATSARAGYFEEAGNGTLFLDEIGELPHDLQPKLLRVLENGEYQRVGETQTRTSQARIIAATNRDLRQEMKAGRFRADLYHRLSVFSVTVPPLREMGNDRLLLLDHFRQRYATQAHCQPFTLDAAAEQLWLSYTFPGNVRELRNIVIRLTARRAGQLVTSEQLMAEFDASEPVDRNKSAVPPVESQRLPALTHLQQNGPIDLDATLAEMELSYIEAALKLAEGNVSKAARLLGINRSTLYNRMEIRQRS
jgi:two-component system nitrogen regulation response regulator GlnG